MQPSYLAKLIHITTSTSLAGDHNDCYYTEGFDGYVDLSLKMRLTRVLKYPRILERTGQTVHNELHEVGR